MTASSCMIHDVLRAMELQKPSEPPPASSDGEGGGDAAAQRAACLLVVDDEHDHRVALRSLLEEVGYRVEDASHGREALDRLLAGLTTDLILLDLFMPVMDGWGLWNELKARPAFAAIPVVVMSGHGETVLNAAPVSAGYLRKPLDRSQLLDTIASCLWRTRRKSGTANKAPEGSPEADRVSGVHESLPPSTKR